MLNEASDKGFRVTIALLDQNRFTKERDQCRLKSLIANVRANSFSSSVKNFAEEMSAGRKIAAIAPMSTVAMPSKMKIHRHPARLPTPSILMIAVASKPNERVNIS